MDEELELTDEELEAANTAQAQVEADSGLFPNTDNLTENEQAEIDRIHAADTRWEVTAPLSDIPDPDLSEES